MVHGPFLDKYAAPADGGRRIDVFVRRLRRRFAVLDQGRCVGATPGNSLHARCQRHALRQSPGIWRRRSILRLFEGQFRCPLRRGRNRAEDDVGRLTLSSGRTSRPRRIVVDGEGIVWFAEFDAGKIGRFDPKTETFKEYQLPGPYPTPYALGIDREHKIWYSSETLSNFLPPACGRPRVGFISIRLRSGSVRSTRRDRA